MRFIHTADLHIGKIVNGFQMLNDQRHILEQILQQMEEYHADGLIIAGDVYDKAVPTAEAVECFGTFLARLEERQKKVYIISGNHDSPERIDYFSSILRKRQLYISGTYQGDVDKVQEEDEYGKLNIWLLPFIKPVYVRRYFPEDKVNTFEEGVKTAISHMELEEHERNILVSHQFVTSGSQSPERSDSEHISIGGLDQVDASIFQGFDYVALGHIHRQQKIGGEQIRYSGSPLKYSFSEIPYEKGTILIELKEKGSIQIQKLPLTPLRDLKEIKGRLEELLAEAFYRQYNLDEYFHVILTDENYLKDPIGKLRSVYKNVMGIDYDNLRTRALGADRGSQGEELLSLTLEQLFSKFYKEQNGVFPDDVKQEIISQVSSEIEGGEAK